MDKTKVFRKLKDYIKEGRNAKYNYVEGFIEGDDRPCYCAVGYLLHLAHVDNEHLESLGSDRIETCYTDLVHDKLCELGLTIKDAQQIQDWNDHDGNKDIIRWCDQRIAELSGGI